MPLEKCQKGGRQGYRWGRSGICYTGQDAEARAQEQGKAIEANKRRRK